MQRRTVLARTGALATAALAGCLGSAPGTGPDDDTPTDEPDGGTPTGTVSPTASSFSVTGVDPGEETNEASVSFGEVVTVEGTIAGNNGCYTAVLKQATYDDGTLTVVVKATEREDADACTQALVDVSYEATFSFAGGLPDRVVVEHLSLGERHTAADETR